MCEKKLPHPPNVLEQRQKFRVALAPSPENSSSRCYVVIGRESRPLPEQNESKPKIKKSWRKERGGNRRSYSLFARIKMPFFYSRPPLSVERPFLKHTLLSIVNAGGCERTEGHISKGVVFPRTTTSIFLRWFLFILLQNVNPVRRIVMGREGGNAIRGKTC